MYKIVAAALLFFSSSALKIEHQKYVAPDKGTLTVDGQEWDKFFKEHVPGIKDGKVTQVESDVKDSYGIQYDGKDNEKWTVEGTADPKDKKKKNIKKIEKVA